MPDLRALAERDLGVTLKGDWSTPVGLIGPDGVRQSTTGQVLYDMVRFNPENGERVVVKNPVVTLRRSSLSPIPIAGESWIIEIPVDLAIMNDSFTRQFDDQSGNLDSYGGIDTVTATYDATAKYTLSPSRPPEGGASIGFIRLYLQALEQI